MRHEVKRVGGELGRIRDWVEMHFPERRQDEVFAFLAARFKHWSDLQVAHELNIPTGQARGLLARGERAMRRARQRLAGEPLLQLHEMLSPPARDSP